MQQPTITVIIPAFNAEKSIERTLRSVTQQTYNGQIEIIVVNDGSSDSTLDVIQSFSDAKANKCHWRIIDQENSGVSAARNAGLAIAKGDYIAFLDSDDFWAPEKLTRQVSEMQKSPDGDWLCLTNIRVKKPDGREEDAWPYPSDLLNPKDPLDLEKFCKCQVPVLPSTWLGPRSVFQSHGGFDERLKCAEDGEWVLRLLKNGGQLRMIDAPLTTYSAPEGKTRLHREESFEVIRGMHLDWMQKNCPPLAAYFIERSSRPDSSQKTNEPSRSNTGLMRQTALQHNVIK